MAAPPAYRGQLDYALDDVRYLVPVYEYVLRELETRDRLAWARDEFLPLENAARYRPADPQDLYLRVRGVERVRGKALAALRELVAWREEAARQHNLPIGRIARDEVLLELARHPRTREGAGRGARVAAATDCALRRGLDQRRATRERKTESARDRPPRCPPRWNPRWIS